MQGQIRVAHSNSYLYYPLARNIWLSIFSENPLIFTFKNILFLQ